MLNNRISNLKRSLSQRSVDYNIDPYMRVLEQINQYDFSKIKDNELQCMSQELIHYARTGTDLNKLLVKAYALVREASFRVLGMKPYDVQVIAGIVMQDGGMVQMQTGEGKTLTAVMPAYLNALSGKGVHVLTFNDYLAKRDAEWMGPVYNFLGLSVSYVKEGMSNSERRQSYFSDITYLTAKEAGFDYLKGFLCTEPYQLVQRPFNFALVDEADSILIDEARIPLVIAGRTEEDLISKPSQVAELVRSLTPEIHYKTDENDRNVFLTDIGISFSEKFLGCQNLYDDKNLKLLVDINNALHAEVLLKKDVDYIVRNGKIELVDEFTGRVAEKRHWPYGLQEAIEVKEGIIPENKGQILASITLQNFIRQYPKICGMTGTAVSAAEEFRETYGLNVVVIPTNKPCIRVDFPDEIYTHKKAKQDAVVAEIAAVHSTGRPILIGTASVEESEQLAARLRSEGIECTVLNAKNDELEAGIIAKAGEYGAVTVSTNMAGRGTDIKLGGESEQDRERIAALGGLCVVGMNKHESRRIDDQLRGRAGRQGDPGSTKFFVSLEDDLMLRYKLKELVPEALYPEYQSRPVENKIIKREVERAQRIVEGQNYDIRRNLNKYNMILEQQRKRIYRWRQSILMENRIPGFMKKRLPEKYDTLSRTVGERALFLAERQVALYFINKCWADYIDYMSYIKDSIHLVNAAGKTPIDEYNRIAVNSMDILLEEIEDEIVKTLDRAEITGDGINMEKEGLKAPTSTWTYLVNDNPDQLGIMTITRNPFGAILMGPLIFGMAVWNRFFRYKHLDQD